MRIVFEHFETDSPEQLWRVELLKGEYKLIRYYSSLKDVQRMQRAVALNPSLTLVSITHFEGTSDELTSDEGPSVSQFGANPRGSQE